MICASRPIVIQIPASEVKRDQLGAADLSCLGPWLGGFGSRSQYRNQLAPLIMRSSSRLVVGLLAGGRVLQCRPMASPSSLPLPLCHHRPCLIVPTFSKHSQVRAYLSLSALIVRPRNENHVRRHHRAGGGCNTQDKEDPCLLGKALPGKGSCATPRRQLGGLGEPGGEGCVCVSHMSRPTVEYGS